MHLRIRPALLFVLLSVAVTGCGGPQGGPPPGDQAVPVTVVTLAAESLLLARTQRWRGHGRR